MATYSITEWAEHQHYKDRDPTWVKLYQKTLTSITWLKADLLARTIMLASLLLAARYKNAIPIDEDVLIPALAPRSTKWEHLMISLRYLHDSGFLSISDDDGLALTRTGTRARTRSREEEKEEEKEEEERKNPSKSPQGDEHEKFDAFWQAYPSRGKSPNPRKPACKAFNFALKRGADPDELVRLAPTAAPSEKHGTEFVPQAATWLNQDRWRDDPAAQAAAAAQAQRESVPPPELEGWRLNAWKELGPTGYESWFAKTTDVRTNGHLELWVQTKFQHDWIRDHYGQNLDRWAGVPVRLVHDDRGPMPDYLRRSA